MESSSNSKKFVRFSTPECPTESEAHTLETCDTDTILGPSQVDFYTAPNIYYGVLLPADKKYSFNSPLVFSTKDEALKVISQYPGSRLQIFSPLDVARKFASLSLEESCASLPPCSSSSVPLIQEKVSKYRTVCNKELVKLTKAIETGNKCDVLEYVWFNPRYLINSTDGPTILQVGPRYNALHVAAKARQTEMCSIVLDTISNLNFLALLYPNDQMLNTRRCQLLYNYLNMPDRILLESPLHFAAKYGALDIVQIFLSFPESDKYKPNKYGFSPEHMLSESIRPYVEHYKELDKLLTAENYIPVLRDQDCIDAPIIGQPCGSCSVSEAISGSPWPFHDQKSNLVSCAFAGPMLYEQAMKFYITWKRKRFAGFKYTIEEIKFVKDICKSDPVKGLERIGRKLAKNHIKTGWIEYWKILNTWVDVCSSEGLELLEEYIKDKAKKIDSPYTKQEKMQSVACSASAEEEMDISEPGSPESDMFIEFDLSHYDIDLFRAIEEENISPEINPYVFKWKCMVEEKLGPMLNRQCKISYTPPSSAAAVLRAMKSGRVLL